MVLVKTLKRFQSNFNYNSNCELKNYYQVNVLLWYVLCVYMLHIMRSSCELDTSKTQYKFILNTSTTYYMYDIIHWKRNHKNYIKHFTLYSILTVILGVYIQFISMCFTSINLLNSIQKEFLTLTTFNEFLC